MGALCLSLRCWGKSGRLKCMLALATTKADQYAILNIQRHQIMAQALGDGLGYGLACSNNSKFLLIFD
jgi:hypothetical protein